MRVEFNWLLSRRITQRRKKNRINVITSHGKSSLIKREEEERGFRERRGCWREEGKKGNAWNGWKRFCWDDDSDDAKIIVFGGGDNEEAIARVHPLVRRSVHARRVVRLGELYLFHHQRWEY